MSSPHLNNLIIVGCILTYSSVIFLGLDSQLSSVTAFPYICTARAWLLMAGFSLAFGSMFSKTWRVHSIFTDVKLNKKNKASNFEENRRKQSCTPNTSTDAANDAKDSLNDPEIDDYVITDYQLFMVVGVLLFVDLVIMTTWQVADPFYRETKEMDAYPHPSNEDIMIIPENEYCQSDRMSVYLGSIYAYKGLLMIFGAFLAWETRHVSIPALNDSKYVGMSVYNVVIMCITGAAISIVLADKQDAMFIMLAVFIIFCSTATLCLVFVPKLIELRRNPLGAIDKRTRTILKPMSKTRKDSTVSELEDRLKDITITNQKYRKQLLEKESELQMYLRRLGDDETVSTQEVINRLHIPKQDIVIKKEGPSVNTETTDISVSMCSLNSTTASQGEGDYVNVSSIEQQLAKKKTSKVSNISTGGEQTPMVVLQDMQSTRDSSTLHPLAVEITGEKIRRGHNEDGENSKSSWPSSSVKRCLESSIDEKQQQQRISYFVPEVVEETDSVVLEHTEISSNDKSKTADKIQRAKFPTPPPSKNVSFDELQDKCCPKQSILPAGIQFAPRHRDGGCSIIMSSHQISPRRSSVKNNGFAQSHHELFENRRTSVPANSISYISNENIAKTEESFGSYNKTYVIGECGHKKLHGSSTGYRCEKHGGRSHNYVILNDSKEIPGFRKHRNHHDAYNSSSISINISCSDTEKCDETVSAVIQRSVSERSREKCMKSKHPVGECPHRSSRRVHECRHIESRLKQQTRLEYVQSTPNVATIHNSKFDSNNPRGRITSVGSMGGITITAGGMVGRSKKNESQMYSALSDGELLDLTILPIFQKLLTERHKDSTRNNFGANVASCPNISIKCDIVEYL